MSKTNFKHQLPAETDAKEKWKTQGGWLPTKKANPITDDAVTFYADSKKPLKQSVDLTQRHAELEREAWTDKVFVGDNTATTAALAQSAAQRNDALQKGTRALIDNIGAIGGLKPKQERASTSTAGAQLASLESVGVEIALVKDIRRALRRKYASRSNIERIFQQWDRKHTGAVSAEDICAGLNKIGIRASLEEAMALKASAAKDANGNLNLQEFSDLIFSADENLNVDLSAINAPT